MNWIAEKWFATVTILSMPVLGAICYVIIQFNATGRLIDLPFVGLLVMLVFAAHFGVVGIYRSFVPNASKPGLVYFISNAINGTYSPLIHKIRTPLPPCTWVLLACKTKRNGWLRLSTFSMTVYVSVVLWHH